MSDITSIEEIKHKTITGFFWQLAQKFSTQGVSFIISIVLARLLMPEDFGLIAMTTIFLRIAGIFVESGLGTSLVQSKSVDERDYNTVFWASLCLSLILYLLVFTTAPLIAQLYHNDLIASIIRVLGLNILFSAFSTVQNASVMRVFDYKKFFYVSLIGTFATGATGLMMAYSGKGVWALVGSNLIGSLTQVLAMNRIVKWWPKFQFSLQRLKKLYGYGVNLMFAELLGTFFNELRGFLIGLKYRPSDLAFYNRGDALPQVFSNNISGTLNGVLFPAMSRVQDDKMQVKAALRRSIMTSSFFIIPVMFLMSAMADKAIIVLYGEKWAMAIPFMQVISFKYCFNLLGGANTQAIKAIGRSDVTLKLEFIKKPLFFIMLMITMQISPLAICIGNTIYDFVGASINAYPNKRFLNYSYIEQLKDIAPQVLISLITGIVVFALGFLAINIYITLFLQIVTGVLCYWGLARSIKLESYRYILATIKEFRGK